MSPLVSERPAPTEHVEYYGKYIGLVPDGDIVATLRAQTRQTLAFLEGIDEQKTLHRYAPEKWSIRQVLGHLVDSERVFAYRTLRIARGDQTPLPGFEQDDWMKAVDFDQRPWKSLLAEYRALRDSNIELFASLDDAALPRAGTANDAEISVRALIWIIAGHELHHVKILRERYLA